MQSTMKHAASALLLAALSAGALAQGMNSTDKGGDGRAAGVGGGAGAAGQAGTDPATLTRTEEQRVAKQKDKAKKGAPTIKPGSGTDTRYGAGSN
ncbi:hypothetical protein AWB67_03061 [Caballeronia terrestris]|jgi:hypothetical protein|uniref:Uncharacterized protein n=1 Tax=Caballeronia terrestris TaxID=1226301 RepID=A0A158IZ77_9BURK|nr:hypothetical protein [Caballeronia terrestris]SAL61400.1 hypothetical protein AWB67_03061 [Caballeronia terrestris]